MYRFREIAEKRENWHLLSTQFFVEYLFCVKEYRDPKRDNDTEMHFLLEISQTMDGRHIRATGIE